MNDIENDFDVSLLIGCGSISDMNRILEKECKDSILNLTKVFQEIEIYNLDLINIYLENEYRPLLVLGELEVEEDLMSKKFDDILTECLDYMSYNESKKYTIKYIFTYMLSNDLIGIINIDPYNVEIFLSGYDFELYTESLGEIGKHYKTICFGYVVPNFESKHSIIYNNVLYVSRNMMEEIINE